ncbi:MAG TPA: hypothetical protein VFS31_03635, partial [Chitinophagaceae bacterium]|nr:hypothetical protein [Chitinophagaceae bacterium]
GWELPKNRQAFNEGLPVVQLYDMDIDISEKVNVQAQHPDIVKELTKLMESYISRGRSTAGRPLKNEVPVDLWKKGYQHPESPVKFDPTAQ